MVGRFHAATIATKAGWPDFTVIGQVLAELIAGRYATSVKSTINESQFDTTTGLASPVDVTVKINTYPIPSEDVIKWPLVTEQPVTLAQLLTGTDAVPIA